MSTRSYVLKHEPDGTYKGSFIHFDGYLKKPGVGYTLEHFYNNDDRAEKLVSLGDLQGVGRYLSPSKKSKRFGWDFDMNGNTSNYHKLSGKEQDRYNDEDASHTAADYRDQHAFASEAHEKSKTSVKQTTLGVVYTKPDNVKATHAMPWSDFKPTTFSSWFSIWGSAHKCVPWDAEYVYLYQGHQWHVIISPAGNFNITNSYFGPTPSEAVKIIKHRQNQCDANWRKDGNEQAKKLIEQFSQMKGDINKSTSIFTQQAIMSMAYRKAYNFAKRYDNYDGISMISCAFEGGYNDTHDGILPDVKDHDTNINLGKMPEYEYNANVLNDAINSLDELRISRSDNGLVAVG